MNRKEAAELSPIIQAFSEGRPIQYRIKDNKSAKWDDVDKNYHDFSPHSFQYRIKPEPKYRPFANAKECWQEMLKHQPFGWLKYKKYPYFALITTIHSGNTVSLNGKEGWDFLHIMNDYVFADNIPLGVKVEE